MKKKICLLGSTGSIGIQTTQVISEFSDKLELVSVASYGKNINIVLDQIKKFNIKKVAIFNEQEAIKLKEIVSDNVKVLTGIDGLIELVTDDEVDIVVSAIVGFVGLIPTYEAAKRLKRIALVNKESMVVGGHLFRDYLNNIVPVDSEHSAIFQVIDNRKDYVKELILTASGGPFFRVPYEKWESLTLKDALKHPVWKMGAKITIDSATLMNKALEIIEAYFLFNIDYHNIKVVIHPQSIVHSFVVFKDGSYLAQLGLPDMRLPILYSLSYPERWENNFEKLDIIKIGDLNFYEVPSHFRAINLAYSVLSKGGVYPVIFNAANEQAVNLFLEQKIRFIDIVKLVEDVLSIFSDNNIENPNIDELKYYDDWARKCVINLATKSKFFYS
ncbi:MAG: 1-deoxy-D-xylulose-5-phosphate reductoisomerase [bacterium]